MLSTLTSLGFFSSKSQCHNLEENDTSPLQLGVAPGQVQHTLNLSKQTIFNWFSINK